MRSILRILGVPALVAALVFITGGCGGTTTKSGQSANEKDKKEKKDQLAQANDDTSEDGFWCNEHGIPEEKCSMCSVKVEKECKAKGDWCDKHNRAKSQCFKCDPSLKAKYDAEYREHYKGKEPPPIKD